MEPKEHTPEELAEIHKERIISSAEFVEGGAKVGSEGNIIFTEEQIEIARNESKYDLDPNYREGVDLISFINKFENKIKSTAASTDGSSILRSFFPTSDLKIRFSLDEGKRDYLKNLHDKERLKKEILCFKDVREMSKEFIEKYPQDYTGHTLLRKLDEIIFYVNESKNDFNFDTALSMLESLMGFVEGLYIGSELVVRSNSKI